jgi:hypothetical protein
MEPNDDIQTNKSRLTIENGEDEVESRRLGCVEVPTPQHGASDVWLSLSFLHRARRPLGCRHAFDERELAFLSCLGLSDAAGRPPRAD